MTTAPGAGESAGVLDSAPHSNLDPPPLPPIARIHRPLLEVAAVFTKLGFTAFGGPAAHVALIEDQVVTRRRWIDRNHFLDIVSAINFIPGPNSTELVMHLGYLRAGFVGLCVAGICFITPAMLIILPIAYMYSRYGTLPAVTHILAMVSCAIVAIVAHAAWRFTAPMARNRFQLLIMLGAIAAMLLSRYFNIPQPELILLALAGFIGAARAFRPPPTITVQQLSLLPVAAAQQISFSYQLGEFGRGMLSLCAILLKIGATLFGSGYVLVSYLRSDLVTSRGWLTEQQLMDAIAVGQFTPGPLLTTSTFIGYILGQGRFGGGHLGGIVGGALATIAIFLPSFIFVAILGPVLQKIRSHRVARNALDAMNAAVAALLICVTFELLILASRGSGWIGIIVIAAAAIALWKNINSVWIILAAIAIGVIVQAAA